MGYMPPQRHNNGVNIHLLPDRNEVKLTTVSKAPFSYLLRRRWWDFGIPWMPRWLATRHHYHLFLYHHHHQDAVARAKRVADCLPLAPRVSSCLLFFFFSSAFFTTFVFYYSAPFLSKCWHWKNCLQNERRKILQGENVVAFSTEKRIGLAANCLPMAFQEKINCQASVQKHIREEQLTLLINWVSSLNR